MKKVVVCTQIYLIAGKRICLPLKKRGFGKGWHNGYGGKVKKGETLKQSAKRELLEESKVKAKSLKKIGKIIFDYLPEHRRVISHIYWCEKFENRAQETGEMKPFWFNFKNIPYKKMWPDDKYWMSKLLKKQPFEARFEFLDSNYKLGKFVIKNLRARGV